LHYIREAVELADRVGVNLEAPNKDAFSELCPDKGAFKEAVIKRLTWITNEVQRAKQITPKPKFGFAKAGVDTQMIVGATDDNDWQFLQVTEWLYKKQGLKRVYYSGFEPIVQTPLERRRACSPWREYRLYQCSFLIRDYEFKTDHLAQIVNDEGFLFNTDPKLAFAKANPDMFPINLNAASYREIVRIPNIGPVTAKRIMRAREKTQIHYSADLGKIIGAKLCRRVSRYIELKDKKFTDF
ncbi:helix-hairpin-helix domain-containing protein, partial [Candidatus Bathyarchaeota archaeon]|nr:helix-hairpin-helix domain-containing protein [Candidatus Bathyarchaeota archaeon]